MGGLFPLLALASLLGTSTATVESFDYVIVGAGTSGLVVANRLSEDSSVTVAVIEPGTDQRDNPNVTTTSAFGLSFGTSIDWAYNTAKQTWAGNREFGLHQGKAWGGTSTINGMTYIRGNVAEFDAWEHLGNPGWNWDALFPYFKKSENYTVPSDTQMAAGATYSPQYHGSDGPLHVGYTPALQNGSFAEPIMQTRKALSLSHNPDLNSGDVRGFGMGPQTLDGELNVRWDAARAYYHPVEHRPNLKILKGTVKRIIWAEGRPRHSQPLVAKGVEILADDGKCSVKTLTARKEIIVSAGALRTPLVLEASGIGNPRVLEPLGIETRVNLPGVGENLVEQPAHFLTFQGDFSSDLFPASAYHTYVTAADIFGADVAAVEKATRDNLSKWAQAVVNASGPADLDIRAVEKLLETHHDLLFKHNATAGEIITMLVAPGVIAPKSGLASNYWLLLPFSRGSVHLKSLHKVNEPLIDPRLFLADFDVSALTFLGRFVEKFWFSDPMKTWASPVPGPLPDGSYQLPNNATDAEWDAYLRDTVVANSHPMGTASMMSRELGGVVDPELRVYGTANVRIVDASVLPTQISGHLTAALYAVAERASDIIKRTSKKH